MRTKTLLRSVLILCGLAGTISAAQVSPTPNFAQSEAGVSDIWHCPVTGGFVDVPNMQVAITTSGGPVLVLVMLNPVANGDFTMQVVIDGAATPEEAVLWLPPATTIDIVGWHRIYELPAGAHTFSVELGCSPPDVNIRGRRLTAYELPAPAKK